MPLSPLWPDAVTSDESPWAFTLAEARAYLLTDHSAGAEAVIRLACDALVASLDGPALATLAGLSLHEPRRVVEDAATDAVLELDGPAPDPETARVAVLALRFACAQFSAGRWSAARLAEWASVFAGDEPAQVMENLALFDALWPAPGLTAPRSPKRDDAIAAAAAEFLAASRYDAP